MAIVQDSFDIPADIMTKLLTGEYRRIGGVVRVAIGPNKGQIVKHLDPVDIKIEEGAKSIGRKILQFVKNHKKGTIIVGVMVAGGIIYYTIRSHEPFVLTHFRKTLRVYLAEIRKGNLQLNTINSLMSALDDLKRHKNFEKFEILLSADDIDILVSHIYDYTIHLAQKNMVELSEEDFLETDNSILNLQNYLKTQKRIFEVAS